MLCPYCGKNLMEGSTYCDGCGGTFNVQQPMPQQPMNNMYNNGYGYGYPQPPKKNNNVMIIVIISILIIVGLIVGIVLLTGNSGDENNNVNTNTNTNTNVNTNTNTNTNVNTNTNTNTNTVQPPTPASTVSFLGYTLTVPNGFVFGEYDGNSYIQSNECLIMYMPYDADYNTIVQNESKFLKSFKDNGLNIKSSGSKTYNGTKYYIIIGTLSGGEYGYMFSQMPNGKAFFATISSLSGGLKDAYFQQAAYFFATAR